MASDVSSTTGSVNTSNQTASRTLTTTQDTRDKSPTDLKKVKANKGDSSTKPECVVGIQGFLALCINTTGDYKVCSEIPMSNITSDAQLFLEMKRRYLAKRGSWSRMNIFVKPMTIEFIQVRTPSPWCGSRLNMMIQSVQVLELPKLVHLSLEAAQLYASKEVKGLRFSASYTRAPSNATRGFYSLSSAW
jgi:hypothetical protein